ncbi:MAG TPA: glutamate racemase [Candidatus Limnocylindria bacterium]|nr:glutamate racemase [Candidatus Limnocylindria bacterium]
MEQHHDPRPIGVFDSGVGGLTVLAELHRRLPDEPTIYLGDNARTPYGPRPADEVRRFTLAAAEWLLAQDVKLLLLACNTATARALPQVREMADVPVLGVIRPGAVAAAAATRSRHVGVIATAGTVDSGAYVEAIVEADPKTAVVQLACPELVPMVEAGILDGRRAETVLRGYLDPLLGAEPGMDTLLLGCTHYPLLREPIERIVGARVSVVDSAFTTALAVEDLLDALGRRAPAGVTARHRVATTGDVDAFVTVAERLFGDRLPDVESVEIEAGAPLPVD